jgi:uncharacterized membrane protein
MYASSQVVSALTARHIGGAVNYMAVSETLKLSPSVFGAGLAGKVLPKLGCDMLVATATLALPHDELLKLERDAGSAA